VGKRTYQLDAQLPLNSERTCYLLKNDRIGTLEVSPSIVETRCIDKKIFVAIYFDFNQLWSLGTSITALSDMGWTNSSLLAYKKLSAPTL